MAAQTFSQGLWHSQDPRIAFHQDSHLYYSVHWESTQLMLYKHASLVDRGVGKPLPKGFPVMTPFFVDSLGGQNYNCWVAVGDVVWTLPQGEDPYDNIDHWQPGPAIASPGSFDFAVLRDPQHGPYKNKWYLLRAANDRTVNYYGESLFISEILSLDTPPILNNPNNDANTNRILVPNARDGSPQQVPQSPWMDIIIEAPSLVVNQNDVFLVYAGNGTQNDDYAVGVAVLDRGADPASPNSWFNQNANECLPGSMQSAFKKSNQVFGPGVAQLFASPDGTESWMMYHSKTWSTGPDPTQDINEMFNRYISLQKISWSRSVVCNGNTYTFPNLGTPQAPGALVALPSGDPGVTDRYVKIEAETMISTGWVLGTGVKTLPRQLIVLDDPNSGLNPEVIVRQDPNCSNGSKVTHFLELAQDQPTLPNRSSLLWRNAPQASYLAVTLATDGNANLDLYINSTAVGQLDFASSGGSEIFKTYQFAVSIPHGAEVRLVYERGRSVEVDVDYIELSPTPITVPAPKVGGTTAAPSALPASSSSNSTSTSSTGGSSVGGSGSTSTGGAAETSTGTTTGLLPPPMGTTGGTAVAPSEPEQVSARYGCSAIAMMGGWWPSWLAFLWAQRRRRPPLDTL